MIDVNFWMITTDFLGKMCLGVMALRVHEKIRLERKIDKKVFERMKREQYLGLGSIALFTISYALSFFI